MLKTCLSCKKEKPIEEFPGRSDYTVEGIQRRKGKCRICFNRDFRNRKKMTREEYLASVSKQREKLGIIGILMKVAYQKKLKKSIG